MISCFRVCDSNAVGCPESTIFINLIPPTVVAWLLQYSGFKVKHRDEFSSYKWLAVKAKMVNLFWILGFCKNSEV